jgi:NAD/NADP transhydrogenase beta subunit
MEGVIAAVGAAADNGHGAVSGEILWSEGRILGYVMFKMRNVQIRVLTFVGWAKYMEWQYPVEIVFTNPKTFKLAGAIEAAATL